MGDEEGTIKDGSWKAAQKMMNNPRKFIQILKSFKACIDSGMVPQPNIQKARMIQEQMGNNFSHACIVKKSAAAAGLCLWIINIIRYYDVVSAMDPLSITSNIGEAFATE